MKYKLTKMVDAENAEDAIGKAASVPWHDVFIAQKEWEENGYGKDEQPPTVGFPQ